MHTLRRSVSALRRPVFGRGRTYILDADEAVVRMQDDLRLFLLTFAGGFLFMTVYLI